jgi:hypothetical protein
MADLVVIVPSRGRPVAARELAASFAETCTADTRLVFALDSDDPELSAYPTTAGGEVCVAPAPSNMVLTLNLAAKGYASYLPNFAIGFMGDDHRPRTVGWDSMYLDTLRELGTGLVYGDDLIQGERVPTQVAMTSDIVRALGYMAPPQLVHLFVDNFWLSLGRLAGCIRYRSDVVIEHMHPVAGKAGWDEGHKRVNTPEYYARDEAAWRAYIDAGHLAADVAKVEALREAR